MKPISVKKRTIKTPPGERALTAAIYILLGTFSLSTLYPFVNIIAKAFSGYTPNVTGLWPMEFQTGTFMRVLTNPQFFTSFWVSLRVTVLGTGLSLFFSSLAGYVLSRERLKGRSFLTACFVFTMMFSGGMIPNYILVRSLHMLDTLMFPMIAPGGVLGLGLALCLRGLDLGGIRLGLRARGGICLAAGG